MLFSVVPSELYCGDKTLDTLMQAMVGDLSKAYEDGVDAALFPIGMSKYNRVANT